MNRALIGLLAWAAIATVAEAQTVGTCSPALSDAYLDIGNVRARLLNNGGMIRRGKPHIYSVPKWTHSSAMFAAGFWMAGMMGGTLRAAGVPFGAYEFWPGPLDEAGNPPADCAVYDRIYRVSRADVVAYEATGAAPLDLMDWPTGLGAPTVNAAGTVIDLSAEPLAARADRRIDLASGERPSFVGDQMAWWVMNDMGNVHVGSKGDPLEVEVQVTAFAFDEPGHVGNATFYRYTIVKKGSRPLTDAYVSFFSDPDLGDFGDDWVGSDSLLGLGYVWNSDNNDGGDEGYGTPPPALGFDFFQGPIVPSPGDVARVGGREIPDYRDIRMTSFSWFHEDWCVSCSNYSVDQYNVMRGLHPGGAPITEGGNGRDFSTKRTRFMFSGDAADCGYWTECNANGIGGKIDPGDRRLVISSGPFTIEPGGRQEILVGIVYARGDDNFDSVRQLKLVDASLQHFVDSGFTEWPAVPEAPAQPAMAGSPGNGVAGQPLMLRLEWVCPAEAVYCRMQWDDDVNFGSPTEQSYGSSASLELAANTTYWWRIRSVGAAEVSGPWSESWSFSTGETVYGYVIQDFSTTSNGAGPLDPPECAAFTFNGSGFPSRCLSDRPNTAKQQVSAPVAWGIHAGDANIRFGPPSDPRTFLGVLSRGRGVLNILSTSDWEIRFTQRGGKAKRQDGTFMDVPFEAWRIGRDTPADASDDTRLLPVLTDKNLQRVFDIGGDHAISGGVNDPVTDWMTVYLPDIDADGRDDIIPGEEGYESWVLGSGGVGSEVWANLVLVCLDCGTAPPYPMPYPEIGTTFRISTLSPAPAILAAPAPGIALGAGDVRFFWTAQTDVNSAIQVASDAGFLSIMTDVPSATSGLSVSLPQTGSYWWRVGSDLTGWSEAWSFTVAHGVAIEETDGELPTEFALDAIWPNPFNPLATIRFGLPADAEATVDVVDVLGRRVAVIDAGARRAAGWHTVQFDGSRLASGVYFVRLAAGGRLDVKSVVLLK